MTLYTFWCVWCAAAVRFLIEEELQFFYMENIEVSCPSKKVYPGLLVGMLMLWLISWSAFNDSYCLVYDRSNHREVS